MALLHTATRGSDRLRGQVDSQCRSIWDRDINRRNEFVPPDISLRGWSRCKHEAISVPGGVRKVADQAGSVVR